MQAVPRLRPPKGSILRKSGSEYRYLRVDGTKTLAQAREKVAVIRLGTLNIALPQMGFIANFGQRCPAVVEHRVNELPECGQTPVARQDLLDHFDTQSQALFPSPLPAPVAWYRQGAAS